MSGTPPSETASIASGEVLDLLTGLVEKSLVLYEEQDGEGRYRLLETVRQYSRDRLQELGDIERVRDQHRDFFLGLAERAEPELFRSDQEAWLTRLEAEHDNLRASLDCAAERGEVRVALRLAGALVWFWYIRDHFREGLLRLEQVLELVPRLNGGSGEPDGEAGQSEPLSRCRPQSKISNAELTALQAEGLFGVGLLSWGHGDYVRARDRLEESKALLERLGEKRGLGYALCLLGIVMLGQGDHTAARSLCDESVEIMREVKDKWGLGLALSGVGELARYQGDYLGAALAYDEGLALFRDLGEKWGTTAMLHNLAYVAQHQDDLQRAAALFKESLALCRKHRDQRWIAYCLAGLAGVVAGQGEPERAARLFGAAEAWCDTAGVHVEPADRVEYDRNMAVTRTALGDDVFAAAWAEGRAMSLEQATDYALEEPPDG